jgi:hypothetical protein
MKIIIGALQLPHATNRARVRMISAAMVPRHSCTSACVSAAAVQQISSPCLLQSRAARTAGTEAWLVPQGLVACNLC